MTIRHGFGAAALLVLLIGAGCGGGGGGGGGGADVSGRVMVTLSDPPSCSPPNGPFLNVWVTVTRVRAHVSATAETGAAGWVEILDLRAAPVQVDLLALGTSACLLTTLGATTGLPVGDYQQIRIHLLENNPPGSAAVPAPNACAAAGAGVYNCVVHATLGAQPLLLSSQANTGIKIPPGRIVGGAITVGAGEAVDLNIDFDACRSIIQQGNGQFRLRPTLSAGEVSPATLAITGRLVDAATGNPIPGATAIVLAEMPDAGGVDRVVAEVLADPAAGTFSFCPLPAGTYDLVAAARDAGGATWHPTVTFQVPVGTAVGDIPLVAIAGPPVTAATISGGVSSAGASGPAPVDLDVSALQTATPAGGSPVLVTMPLFPGSTPTLPTETGPSCAAGTACATYMLVLAPGLPSTGTFAAGATTFYSTPAAGPAPHTVHVFTFDPGGLGLPACSPSFLSTNQLAGGGSLDLTPGAAVTASPLAFTGC